MPISLLSTLETQLRPFLAHQRPIVLALSGGLDSVVLLTLLTQLRSQAPFALRALHVHHGLSLNADRWADFCAQLCAEQGVPFRCLRVQVTGEKGLEANARAARYEALKAELSPDELLLTAHHLDDQAETFLLALKRGSGVKGLSAIQPLSAPFGFEILRPLLNVSRATLHAFAEQAGLDWVEDESNMDTRYDRNFLRQTVLPQLNARWHGFSAALARSAQHCQQEHAFFEKLLLEKLSTFADFKHKTLQIAPLLSYSLAEQAQFLRLWLSQCGQLMPERVQLEMIQRQFICDAPSPNASITLGAITLRAYQMRLYLLDTESQPPRNMELRDYQEALLPHTTLTLPHQLGTITHLGNAVQFEQNEFALSDALCNEALNVRFQPPSKVALFGSRFRQEMKKIWRTHRIPPWLRARTPLLFYQDQLILPMQNTKKSREFD